MRPIFEWPETVYGVWVVDDGGHACHTAATTRDGGWPDHHYRSPTCWCRPALTQDTWMDHQVWSHLEPIQ